VDLANLGNVNVPPTAHQQGMGFQRSAAATTGVSTSASLYDQQQQQALDDQQKQALADQQWVLDFVQNVNAISERRVFLFYLFINYIAV
jgi:hypothetical protein